MSDKLLPCPFCGGEPKLAAHPGRGRGLHAGETVYSIDCMTCGASAVNRYREHVIVAAWNRRAAPPAATRRSGDRWVGDGATWWVG